MTGTHIGSLVVAAAVVFWMIQLLRSHQLKEKYAVLWLGVGLGTLILGAFPVLLNEFADRVGVKDPPNLLLFAAAVLLLLVCVHLSWESSRLEEETRTLAEEVALLRQRLEDLER
ncbi:MAG: DUF2304 domain-containing protein [Acidimicrobiales bacterium]|nr:DUF2304 domain-containing protein [Acidimicrobiales bacterium]